MESNMDDWQSFRIKISHRDTYTEINIFGGIVKFNVYAEAQ